MSIGKVVNNVTLVSADDATVIKTVEVCKGIIDTSTSTVTVTKWGENILPWVKSLYPDEDTEGQTGRWRLNGLISSTIFFDRNKYGGTKYTYTMYEGDYNAETNRSYADQDCIDSDDISVQTSVPSSPAGFRGYGFFIVYDDSWNSEKPRYAFVTAPAKIIGGTMRRGIITFPTPYVHNWTKRKGYISGDMVIGYNTSVYTNKIYENYTNSDYSSTQANGSLVYGFPYADGESDSKGGQGDMVDTSTPIPIDEPRTLFVGNLFRVYNMTVTALSELSNFLLDPSFTASVSKLFNDPMDYLTSLVAIPFSAFGGNTEPITIGSVSSNIEAKRLNNFIADLDCGEINFIEYFETFMDYSPYTRVTIYLPMIGYININVDAFQNDKLALKYRIDVLTGQCVAFLSNSKGLVASYNGNCAYHIPLRSRDYSQMISGIANATASALIGGVSAPSFNGALNGALNFKPAGSVTTAGAFSGNSGVLTNKKPYIIIERPSISIPRSYPHNIGYKSEITAKLSDLHGFTTVKAIHLDNVVATTEEKDELETLLLSGVVLP